MVDVRFAAACRGDGVSSYSPGKACGDGVAATASRRTWLYATGTPSRRWRCGGRSATPPARSRRRLRRRRERFRCCADSAKKLKLTGAIPSPQIASRRCCVRAARAFLLGHRAGVALWSVCCSVLSVGRRAQSVPARRAQFFTGVLRSQRQSCHKLASRSGRANRAYSERQK